MNIKNRITIKQELSLGDGRTVLQKLNFRFHAWVTLVNTSFFSGRRDIWHHKYTSIWRISMYLVCLAN